MLGLTEINHLTHKIENVFDAARKNELAVNGDVTELVFMGLDQLTALIERLKEPEGEPVDCSAVLDAIRRLLQTAGVERKQSSQAEADKLMSAETGRGEKHPAGNDSSEAATSGQTSAASPLEGVQDEGQIPQKYLSIFIDECEASLETLTGTLLALERGGRSDDLKSLMGTAHKIKGSAAAIGLNRIAKLAHLIEDVLQESLQTHGSLPAGVTDVLLKCTDALQKNVTERKAGTPQSDPFGQLSYELMEARLKTPATQAAAAGASPVPAAASVKLIPEGEPAPPARGNGPRRRCGWTSTGWTISWTSQASWSSTRRSSHKSGQNSGARLAASTRRRR